VGGRREVLFLKKKFGVGILCPREEEKTMHVGGKLIYPDFKRECLTGLRSWRGRWESRPHGGGKERSRSLFWGDKEEIRSLEEEDLVFQKGGGERDRLFFHQKSYRIINQKKKAAPRPGGRRKGHHIYKEEGIISAKRKMPSCTKKKNRQDHGKERRRHKKN